jgi:hypothetical protein
MIAIVFDFGLQWILSMVEYYQFLVANCDIELWPNSQSLLIFANHFRGALVFHGPH